MVCTGLDALRKEAFRSTRGKSVGLVCNQASISSSFDHAIDLFAAQHRSGSLRIAAVFGPQHGLHGHTQDNMIEWEGWRDPRGWRVHSLYGETRKPSAAMLEGVEALVVDLQDVGARYYTFTWTLALCMEACVERGIELLVLDRPNPIGGEQIQGDVLDPAFASFVGLHPLPMRHGMTIGEIATYLRGRFYPRCALEIVPMTGWSRSMSFEDTRLPWAVPSPNMPTVDTAFVYPGMCLLEGTNLSEGRGTTRPFEIFGAPFLDGSALSGRLNAEQLAGVHFRPIEFEPTFNKHATRKCEGCFIHVLDRTAFDSTMAAVAILKECARSPEFGWKAPPYEYEEGKRPIDILAGNDWLAGAIEADEPLRSIAARFDEENRMFREGAREFLIY